MHDPEALTRRIDVIERGYEYLLAYAAQGRQSDAGSEARSTLAGMYAALEDLSELLRSAVESPGLPGGSAAPGAAGFIEAIEDDTRKARGAIGFVLGRPAISSMLVDNLNASIHLRALLTDIFLVEQGVSQARK